MKGRIVRARYRNGRRLVYELRYPGSPAARERHETIFCRVLSYGFAGWERRTKERHGWLNSFTELETLEVLP